MGNQGVVAARTSGLYLAYFDAVGGNWVYIAQDPKSEELKHKGKISTNIFTSTQPIFGEEDMIFEYDGYVEGNETNLVLYTLNYS